MTGVSKNKLKKIKRERGRKSTAELARELNIPIRDVEKAIKELGGEDVPPKRDGDKPKPDQQARGKWTTAAAVFSVLLTAVCFGASLRYPMVFDDHHSIADNHYIRSVENIPDFFAHPEMFSNEPGRRMFRPLVSSSYAINYAISGLDTASYHLVGYFFHALNGFLIFLLFERIFRSPPSAFFSAMIFVVHPVCTESVVYLSARSTVMGGSFLFASSYFFLRYLEDRRNSKALITSVVFFICGLLCKENLIMAPAIFLLWEKLFEKVSFSSGAAESFSEKIGSALFQSGSVKNENKSDIPFRRKLAAHLPFWAVALVYLLVRKFLLNLSSVVISRNDRTFGEQVLTQAGVWLEYLVKVFFPAGLNNQEYVPVARALWEAGRGISGQPVVWLIVWFFVGWLMYSLRRKRGFLMGVVFAGLILLPETITAMNQLYNERRLYLPLFGVLTAVGGLSGGLRRKKAKVCIAVVCVFLMGMMSFSRTRVWRNEKTLWFDSIRKSPASETNWHGLGYIYAQEGKDEKTLWALRRALNNNLSYAPSLRLYGAVLLKQNKPREAVVYLDRAMKIEKYSHKAWYNLGLALYKLGETGKAEIAFKNAVALNQFYPLPHYMLAKVYWERGDRSGALKEIEEAIRRDPQNKLYLKYKDYILGEGSGGEETEEERIE